VTDIATGWTENRSVRNKAEKWVFEALMDIRAAFTFPIIGVLSASILTTARSSSTGTCCGGASRTRRRSPGPGRATVTTAPTSSRRTGRSCAPWSATTATTTTAEMLLLNKIWALQSLMTDYFGPQQKLISKVRNGAKVTKRYDKPKARTGGQRRRSARQDNPRRHLPRAEPRSHPTRDPGTDRPAPDRHHQQERTGPQTTHHSPLYAHIHR